MWDVCGASTLVTNFFFLLVAELKLVKIGDELPFIECNDWSIRREFQPFLNFKGSDFPISLLIRYFIFVSTYVLC